MKLLKRALLTMCLSFGLVHWASAEIVVVVNPQNDVTNLSKKQVSRIFLGQDRRFPNGRRANPVDQDDVEIIKEAFYSKVAKKSLSQLKGYWARRLFNGRGEPPQIVNGDLSTKEYVADHEDAIAYIDSSQVDDTVKVVLVIQ